MKTTTNITEISNFFYFKHVTFILIAKTGEIFKIP